MYPPLLSISVWCVLACMCMCQINNHFKEKRILKYKSLLTDDKKAMLFDFRAYVIPLKTSIKAQSTLHIQIESSLIILF